MTAPKRISAGIFVWFIATLVPLRAVHADIVLSQLIVDLQPGKHGRDDIEIWNSGTERAYVALEPREVVNAGLAGETRRVDPDPEKLGLLVSPGRMILEPGQRKVARIAAIAPTINREKVYRVTVKPVAGPLEADNSALKILIGYDVLVLVRPTDPRVNLTSSKSGNNLSFRNEGNASIELVAGRQCDAAGTQCTDLPSKRIYAGGEWSETLKSNGPVEYTVRSAIGSERRTF